MELSKRLVKPRQILTIITWLIFIQHQAVMALKCSSDSLTLNQSCICKLNGEPNSVDVSDCPDSLCIHGKLVRNEQNLTCSCYKGYQGVQCQLKYCKYGRRTRENKCACEAGFTGENCQSMICENGGRPITKNGWAKCNCSDGFTGKRCDIKVPKCGKHGKVVWVETSDFVKAKLLTVDPSKKLMCHCDSEYMGELCEKRVICRHGTLSPTGFCKCKGHWRGTYCDIPVCDHGTLALNTCICEFGWSGQFCDKCMWGQKISESCVQAYSMPMKDESRSQASFHMSWTGFWIILIVCSAIFLAIGCWIEPRKHLSICFPSLRYTHPPEEQNDAQVAANSRVVVMQDSGVRQIVVNVVPRRKNSNSNNTNGQSLLSTSTNGGVDNLSRRHSVGSRPPSYTKVAQEEEEETLLPSYNDAITRAKSLTIFIDD